MSLKPAARLAERTFATCIPSSAASALSSLFGIAVRERADGSFDVDVIEVLQSPLARFIVGKRRSQLQNGSLHITAEVAAAALSKGALLPLLEQYKRRLVDAVHADYRGLRQVEKDAIAEMRAQARQHIASGRTHTVGAPPPCVTAALSNAAMRNDARFSAGAIASAFLRLVGPKGQPAVDGVRDSIERAFGARRAAHFARHATRDVAERRCCTMTAGAGLKCTASPALCMAARNITGTPDTLTPAAVWASKAPG
jgi:hypothetical protein